MECGVLSPSLPHLEPVVAHGQVEDIIPLLLFAPLGQQLWWVGERWVSGKRVKIESPFS